jgi:exodeoxyribonuclease VII small subunit
MKTSKQDKMTFEEALTRLESLLASLERSDCPLEEALSLYQEGMGLVRLCRGKLSDAENKISILLKDTQEFIPFTGEEESR